MSRKPEASPSVFADPTEINVTGMPPATPTVYWVSKFYINLRNHILGQRKRKHTASRPALLGA
jgi:hypothetical protein